MYSRADITYMAHQFLNQPSSSFPYSATDVANTLLLFSRHRWLVEDMEQIDNADCSKHHNMNDPSHADELRKVDEA
mgnify:CR=1 FL=1